MKRVLISILTIATLASCSKSENKEGTGSDDSAAIILSAGIPTASALSDSKAPIVVGDNFVAGVAGWSAISADYTQAPTWSTKTSSITVSADAQAITLNDPKTYDADNSVKTYMKAWYPEGTLTTTAVSFANDEGSVDAMLSPVIFGSKSDRANKIFAFTHKTTQIKFAIKEGTGLTAGTTIDKITIKSAELPIGFNLSTDAVSYAIAADLDVPGITTGTIIGATATVVGNPVMIKPIATNTITLDITTNHTIYSGITATIDIDPTFLEGRAYTITLTFGQSGIDLKTTVANWTTGTGSGNVQ